MAIVKRKNSQYWWMVLWKNGKQFWQSTHKTDEDEARLVELETRLLVKKKVDEKKLTEFVEKVVGSAVARKGLPIASAWDKFITLPGQSERKKRTILSKRQIWKRFVKWLGQQHPEIVDLQGVDRDVAMEYATSLNGKSAQTYNNARHNLHGIFTGLTHAANLTVNPFDVVPTKSARHTSYRPFSIVEIRKILKTAPEHWRVAVLIALYTGLRFVDVCFLKWGIVDLSKGIIEVEPEKTKRLTKKVKIPIHLELAKELRRLKRDKMYVLPIMAKRYHVRSFQSEFTNILVTCSIKDSSDGIVGFHSLRHTFVTMLEESGASRQVSQKLVGHGSPIMTDLYSHDIKSSKKAISRLPKIA